MLSHWVGTYVCLAYGSLEDGKSAEEQRLKLIEKLKTVQGRRKLTQDYITSLENVKWKTDEDLKRWENDTKKLDSRLFNKLE